MSSNSTTFPSFEASTVFTKVATAVILGLLFVLFVFLLVWRHISGTASRASSVYSTPDNNVIRGLDPLIRDMYPTFLYSGVKRCKEGLECAICLSEMEDMDMLRLLTVCYHVFHQTCIDEWLGKHVTCPICRSNLSNPEKEHSMCPLLMYQASENENGNENEEVTLRVHEEVWAVGESAEPGDKDGDKYKLLITEPVKAEIAKGHRCVRSCTVFGELSNGRGDKPSHSLHDSIP